MRALLLRKGAYLEANQGQRWQDCADTGLVQGPLEVVQALLYNGADIQAKASDGETALIAASTYGHREVVEALLAMGGGCKRQGYSRPIALDGCMRIEPP